MKSHPSSRTSHIYRWIGVCCLLGAFWLALISPPNGIAGFLPMPDREMSEESSKTSASRREGGPGREAVSVAEEYLRKTVRGMTETEVRWVVQDFLTLGLDLEYPEDTTAEGFLALRKARERWYLGALVSGLRLTKEQESDARERMKALQDKRYLEYVKYIDGLQAFEHEGKKMIIIDGGKARALTDADRWLKEEGYRPWELCQLREDQLSLTRFHSENQEKADSGGAEDNAVNPKLPNELVVHGVNNDGLAAMGFGSVDSFFPFSRNQVNMLLGKERVPVSPSVLEQVKVMHSEQLKMFLLFNPQVAKKLINALEAVEKVRDDEN